MKVKKRDGKTVLSRDPDTKRRTELAAKPNRTQAENIELILLEIRQIKRALNLKE